jgi:hypothetical protein
MFKDVDSESLEESEYPGFFKLQPRKVRKQAALSVT